MSRRIFQFASLLSLLLFLAVVTVNVRSHYVSNHWDWRSSRAENNRVTTSRWVGFVSEGGLLFHRQVCTSRHGLPFPHTNAGNGFAFSESATQGYPAIYWPPIRGTGIDYKLGGKGVFGSFAWKWWRLDWTDGVEHEHTRDLDIVIPLTFPEVLLAILPVARFVSMFVLKSPRRRRRMGLCERCGFDLTGNTSGTCPECGTLITRRASAAR